MEKMHRRKAIIKYFFLFIGLVIFANSAIAAEQAAVKVKKHDPALLISVAELRKTISENKNVLVIDVRKPEDFEKIRRARNSVRGNT